MSRRILWVDAHAGLAGDMFCAALLDAGADLEALRTGLERLHLPGWTLSTQHVQRGALRALHFRVHVTDTPTDASDGEHTHHDHGGHTHRTWREIQSLITDAGLPPRVERRALAAFGLLAEAEAHVHGVAPSDVVFHEVGAVDSIIDTVGACLLLEDLAVDEIVVSSLPIGSGTVSSAHGTLTIPAPATLEVLRRADGGWPMFQDGVSGERVTPTGAALAVALASHGDMPSMRPVSTGVGAGTRDPKAIANVVRVVLGSTEAPTRDETPSIVDVVEAQVDDMPGEWFPALSEALVEAGAVDVFTTPVLMKKGRPGQKITALTPLESTEAVVQAMFRHSTTLGVRSYRTERVVLERSHHSVETPWGPIRIKVGRQNGRLVQAAPEYEDCRACAKEAGIPVGTVYTEALSAFRDSD